jgi:hypothetical protein
MATKQTQCDSCAFKLTEDQSTRVKAELIRRIMGSGLHDLNLTVYFQYARKPRIHFPGAFYHVMLRGNGKQNIFFADDDRYRFYLFLQEGIGGA